MSTKDDLTKLDDISEFIHDETSEVDRQLETFSNSPSSLEENAVDDIIENIDQTLDQTMVSSFDDDNDESPTFEENNFGVDDDDNPPDFESDYEEPSFGQDDNNDFESSSDYDDTSFSTDENNDYESLDDEVSFNESDDNDFSNTETEEFDSHEISSEEEEENEAQKQEQKEEEGLEMASSASTWPIDTSQDETENVTVSKKEDFSDIKKEAKDYSASVIKLGGNPPYSILLTNIVYQEDRDDIIRILNEYQLVAEENRNLIEKGLEMGQLLLSQLSEFSAITLVHRLRRFKLDIKMGLSDEVHPSKIYTPGEHLGAISKSQMAQNKQQSVSFEKESLRPENIILSTSSTVDGKQVVKYLGVATEHDVVSESQLKQESVEVDPDNEDDKILEKYQVSLIEKYNYLADRLKNQAVEKSGNAVVGIHFALNPLLNQSKDSEEIYYKITCSGSIVALINQGS